MHNAEEFKAHLETKSNLATRTPLPLLFYSHKQSGVYIRKSLISSKIYSSNFPGDKFFSDILKFSIHFNA